MDSRIIFLLVLVAATGANAAGIEEHFYKKTCPQAEQIAQRVVWDRVAGNPALPAKLIRIFFHDCFIRVRYARGCDGSILLESANGTAEKDGFTNSSLSSGYEVIDDVKTALEAACPGTVSCADIVALAARDSVSFQYKKNLWEVETGRRDGTVSIDQDVRTNIPSPLFDFATLASNFASKGLGPDDLVILSGAHTIGTGRCSIITNRLYNFTGKGDADPSLDARYAAALRAQCPNVAGDLTSAVGMDPDNPLGFDGSYFANLKRNKGLFQSDAALLTNGRSSNLVDKLEDSKNFLNAFKNSISRMGAIGVLTGADGEIRKNCRAPN